MDFMVFFGFLELSQPCVASRPSPRPSLQGLNLEPEASEQKRPVFENFIQKASYHHIMAWTALKKQKKRWKKLEKQRVF